MCVNMRRASHEVMGRLTAHRPIHALLWISGQLPGDRVLAPAMHPVPAMTSLGSRGWPALGA